MKDPWEKAKNHYLMKILDVIADSPDGGILLYWADENLKMENGKLYYK